MADIQVHIGLKAGNGSYVLKKQRINSISSLYQSNSDASTIYYGVLSNTGNIEISDKDGEIKKLVESGKMDVSNVSVKLYANNKMVQGHISSDSEYKDNTLRISLQNKLTDISNIVYKGNDESGYLTEIDASLLLKKICQNSTPSLEIPIEDEDYFKSIVFKDIDLTILNKYTTEELLSYFCNATQSNIFYNNNGDLKIVLSRPIANNGIFNQIADKIFFIPNKCIFEEGEASLFVKNKIKKININVSNADTQYVQMRNKRTVFGNFIGSEQDYLNSVCFDKFNIDNMDFEQEYESGERIYSKEIELDYFIQQKISDMGYTFAVLYENKIQYPETSSGNYAQILNVENMSSFIQKASLYFASTDSLPFYCAFYNYDESRFVKKYKIVCAVRKSAVDKPLNFWIVRKPSVSSTLYMKKTFENIEKQFLYSNAVLKNNETLTLKENPLLTTTSTINISGTETLLYDYIVKNIFDDYINGIKTKTVTVCCSNYKASGLFNESYSFKNFLNGDIFEVGDIVTFQQKDEIKKNNWRITGVNFLYDGEPLLKLELQEAIDIYSKNLVFEYTWYDSDAGKMYGYDCKIYPELYGTIVVPSTYNDDSHGILPVIKVSLPSNVEERSNIEKLYIPNSVKTVWIPSNKNLKEVVFSGDGLETIESYGFAECSSLQKIKIPNSVKDIGTEAFGDCVSLESIVIPKSVSESMSGTFKNCSNLKSVTFENGCKIEYIYDLCDECSSLEFVNLPENLNYIGGICFRNTKIKNIDCPSKLKTIGSRTFHSASELENVKINDGLTAIYEWAFYNCKKLKHIFIPISVSEIGDESSFGWTAPDYSPFLDCSSDLVIYCEATSKPSKWISGWNYYSTTGQLQVKWGYTREQYESEVGLS